jgi:hypothetical protein
MSLSTSAAPQTADKKEETTLEKMSKGRGDRAKSQGGVAEEREKELEEMMERARRLLARQNGPPEVVTQRIEGERSGSFEKGKESTQLAASRSATLATTIDSSLQSERDREARGVLAKIGVDATSARGEVKVALGSVMSMIADLTAVAPPPGVSMVDWADSKVRRAELVKALEMTRAKLERSEGQFGDLSSEATVAGPNGQEPRAEGAKRRIAA